MGISYLTSPWMPGATTAQMLAWYHEQISLWKEEEQKMKAAVLFRQEHAAACREVGLDMLASKWDKLAIQAADDAEFARKHIRELGTKIYG